MSTRSFIGRQNNDGTITSIYHHSDGYPSWLGRMLLDHWTEPAKIEQLFALGSLSHIGEIIGEQHDFDWRSNAAGPYTDAGWGERYAALNDDPRDKMCLAYGRDRGEEDQEAQTFPNYAAWKAMVVESWAEYAYLWGEGGWSVQKVLEKDLGPMQSIPDALAAEAAAQEREAAASDS